MFRRITILILNPFIGFMVEKSLSTTMILLGSSAIIFSIISRVEEEHLID